MARSGSARPRSRDCSAAMSSAVDRGSGIPIEVDSMSINARLAPISPIDAAPPFMTRNPSSPLAVTNSSTKRDLPTPGSPTMATTLPRPDPALAAASSSARSSISRPTKRPLTSLDPPERDLGTPRSETICGAEKPLASIARDSDSTKNRSTSRTVLRLRNVPSGGAACWIRAASQTAGPTTSGMARPLLSSRWVNITSPECRPIRSRMGDWSSTHCACAR